MKIIYFYRNKKVGFSIQTVFKTISYQIQNLGLEVSEVYMPSTRSMPWDIIKNCAYTAKHKESKVVHHITGHINDVVLGLLGKKVVLTVHDLVFIDNINNPIKRAYKWLFWLYLPVKLSDAVVCISKETKDNLYQYIQPKNVQVIYNPIDPAYVYVHKDFNKENPSILHIGTGWNKNLQRVAQSLSGIPCTLRIVGKLSSDQLELLSKLDIDYSNVFNLSDAEIRQEYINCDIVSFPSEYEGFGMPIIEGQKTGRVVLTSNIEPLLEVAGNGVCYVNQLDVDSIRAGFLKVIEDDAYRKEKISLGIENVERFDVKKIAAEYLELYKKILV